jgi:hypothetical protein
MGLVEQKTASLGYLLFSLCIKPSVVSHLKEQWKDFPCRMDLLSPRLGAATFLQNARKPRRIEVEWDTSASGLC